MKPMALCLPLLLAIFFFYGAPPPPPVFRIPLSGTPWR
jgi:hypothetical protein